MTGREILKRALNHEEGPVPVDFGATMVSGMHISCVQALREYYGLEKIPVKVYEPYQMLGFIDDDLKEVLGIDTCGLPAPKTMFGFANTDWKEWRTPWGQEVLVAGDFQVEEQNAEVYIYPQGDRAALPAGRMPEGGYFFDAIIRRDPDFDEDDLKLEDNVEEFGEISAEDLNYYAAQAAKFRLQDRGVVGGLPGTALGDIALVPGPFMKNPKGIRDIADWYMATATEQEFIQEIFQVQVEYALENLPKFYAALGDSVEVVFVCGTDFGTQISTFCSGDTYCKLWMPYYQQINAWVHANTPWKTFKHSCGAVEGFMEYFIESGFDIINPVQCSAVGMDAQLLKDKYGQRLVFWGGGCDTQKLLPFGTPQEVREHVLTQCGIFSRQGGFVFNAVHNVQAFTPTENLVAMFEAVQEFNRDRTP